MLIFPNLISSNKCQVFSDYTLQYIGERCFPSQPTPILLKWANIPMLLGRQHINPKLPLYILTSLNTLQLKFTLQLLARFSLIFTSWNLSCCSFSVSIMFLHKLGESVAQEKVTQPQANHEGSKVSLPLAAGPLSWWPGVLFLPAPCSPY